MKNQRIIETWRGIPGPGVVIAGYYETLRLALA
jgi:hypothetical protein